MRRNLTALLSVALALVQPPTLAEGPDSAPQVSEARSLAQLPAGVANLLGVSNPGTEGVADYGERFNVTDAIREPLPFRRFILAGLSENRAIVALEHGGIGYHIEVLTFTLIKGKWAQTNRQTFMRRDKPTSIPELLQLVEMR